MTVLISFMDAISWPVAFLVFGLAAAFGGLNRPLKAMAEAFGGIFKDLRAFRTELETLERKLAEMPESFSTTISGLHNYVKEIDTAITSKLSEIELQIQTVKDRVTQEALAEETGIEPDDINSRTLGKDEAAQSVNQISSVWADVRESLAKKFPATGNFDKREYGRAILNLAQSSRRSKPSIELAETVASLHSRFKGFTRRKAYAEEWMTAEIRDSYLRDADKAREQLASL